MAAKMFQTKQLELLPKTKQHNDSAAFSVIAHIWMMLQILKGSVGLHPIGWQLGKVKDLTDGNSSAHGAVVVWWLKGAKASTPHAWFHKTGVYMQ